MLRHDPELLCQRAGSTSRTQAWGQCHFVVYKRYPPETLECTHVCLPFAQMGSSVEKVNGVILICAGEKLTVTPGGRREERDGGEPSTDPLLLRPHS